MPIPNLKSLRTATLADVGRAAGVSAMAASIVLSGRGRSSRVSAATRDRILAAAAKLHYRPNEAAQALARLPRARPKRLTDHWVPALGPRDPPGVVLVRRASHL